MPDRVRAKANCRRGGTCRPLPQHKPPQEDAADQQHEGGYAGRDEHVVRLLVRGDLLLVRPLKLQVRPPGGGCGLTGLVPLQLGRSELQLGYSLLQLPRGLLKLPLPGNEPAALLLAGAPDGLLVRFVVKDHPEVFGLDFNCCRIEILLGDSNSARFLLCMQSRFERHTSVSSIGTVCRHYTAGV